MGYDCDPINQQTPGCIVFLVNQSGSMKQQLSDDPATSKCRLVAEAINRFLMTIVVRCTRSDGVWPFVSVGVIGYQTDPTGVPIIESLLKGSTPGMFLVPIGEVDENVVRIEERQQQYYDPDTDELQEIPTRVPIWIDQVAEGAAPVCSAFEMLQPTLNRWCDEH